MTYQEKLQKLKNLCKNESEYYNSNIDLIAASTFLRKEIAFFNDYSIQRSMEGLLNKRPYAGTRNLDEIEQMGVNAAKKVFNSEYANLQPHSGSQANQIVYSAFLNPGDTVLSMSFDSGGHLTHGNPINFSGRFYKFIHYGINPLTQTIDYAQLQDLAIKNSPKIILAGASSYPLKIDYKFIKEIAKEIGADFVVDMAHPAGIIAAGEFPSPVLFADAVTTSTEKTLHGPHAGLILAKEKHAKIIDKATHPGVQSSVPINRIVQSTIALLYAQTDDFKRYIHETLESAQILAEAFQQIPKCLMFNGTDSHFIVIDVLNGFGITGKEAEQTLEKINIFTNRQIIPWETKKVYETSGLRIGTQAACARGINKNDFVKISEFIISALQNPNDVSLLNDLRQKIQNMALNHSIL